MNSIMRAYLPSGTERIQIVNLMAGHGGYTTTYGKGCWRDQSGILLRGACDRL